MPGDLATAHPGEARLRAALAAAASGPVDPAWDAIRARVLDDDVPAPAPLRAPAARRGTRWAVLAAAAVVLVVALGGLVVVGRPDAGRAKFNTVGGAIGGGGAETGWYLPRGLPLGWRVTSVVARRPADPRCPGPEEEPARGIRWEGEDRSSPDGRFALVVTADPCPPSDSDQGPTSPEPTDTPPPPTPVDLGPVTGDLSGSADGSWVVYTWPATDGVTWTVEGWSVPPARSEALARELAATGSFDGPVLAGFGPPADRWTEPPQPQAVIEVGVMSPEGHRLAYELVDSGGGVFRTDVGAVPGTADGVAVRRLEIGSAHWAGMFGRVEPGTDITVWSYGGPDAHVQAGGEVARQRDAELLVAALRPATSDEWQEIIGEVEHAPVLDRADRRADLVDLDVPPRPDLPPVAGSTTSSTAPR